MDGLVEFLEELHVLDVPVVARGQFCSSYPVALIELLSDLEDTTEASLLTSVQLLHLLEFWLEVLDPLAGLSPIYLDLVDPRLLL